MQRQNLTPGCQSEKVSYMISHRELDDFLSVFKKVQTLAMFTWVPRLVDGYNPEWLNMD